jgi:hypothetical protein
MSSPDYYIQLLRTGFLTETSIPTNFLYLPQVIELLQKFNWAIISAQQGGWALLRKNIIYHD